MTKHITDNDAPQAVNLSRRHFFVGAAASGLVLTYGATSSFTEALAAGPGSFAPSVWMDINRAGKVTVHVAKADMGQHIASTMAQLVAEELGSKWSDMRVELASNDPKYGDPILGAIITGGSWSTGMNFDAMCRAGAAGRITLIKAGAEMLKVPEEECKVSASRVVHTKTNKSVTFAQIVSSGKASKTWTPDELKAIKLKTPDQYAMIGKSLPQLDIPGKTNGSTKYGIDANVPGQVYGKLALPPVRYGAKVTVVDDSEAKKVPGFIQAVTLDDKTGTTTGWVVAVATTYQGAMAAASALKITYDKGPNAGVSDETILAESRRLQKDGSKGFLFVKNGDTGAAMGGAAKTFEAEYTTSLNIHAPLEPMNATAMIDKDGVWHIYTGNQFATRMTAIAAATAGVDGSKIMLHQHYLGGGFGRRLEVDMVIPAILAAKAVGKPVKLIYSREDDMAMDFTRPLTYQKVKVGVDASGKPTAFEHDVIGAWPTARWGIPAFLTPSVDKKGSHDSFTVNGADSWYTLPNHTVRNFMNEIAQAATPSGQLRSVAPAWTFWAIESIIDEMAVAAGKDPVEYRLSLLDGKGDNAGDKPQNVGGAKRLANVLQTAVGRSGYGAIKPGKNEGLGVACVSSQERNSPTWTACVAHVAVNPANGEVKVKKLTVAMDVGTAINPDGVRAQIEGSALWGASIALMEKTTMKNGAIQATNFDSYTPMRMGV
jgi:isoquinoline 1-oxidoreductase subunit beta